MKSKAVAFVIVASLGLASVALDGCSSAKSNAGTGGTGSTGGTGGTDGGSPGGPNGGGSATISLKFRKAQ